MLTKPQDVFVALKLALLGDWRTYADLGKDLGMSASEVHAAVRRLIEARLMDPDSNEIRREALRNFLVHGVPYAYPTAAKEMTRGIPTAWAAPTLSGKFAASDQAIPVWPAPDGKVQGAAVEPLYSSVPAAAQRDPALYHLLALVDALRIGRARERAMAERELGERLLRHATA